MRCHGFLGSPPKWVHELMEQHKGNCEPRPGGRKCRRVGLDPFDEPTPHWKQLGRVELQVSKEWGQRRQRWSGRSANPNHGCPTGCESFHHEQQSDVACVSHNQQATREEQHFLELGCEQSQRQCSTQPVVVCCGHSPVLPRPPSIHVVTTLARSAHPNQEPTWPAKNVGPCVGP